MSMVVMPLNLSIQSSNIFSLLADYYELTGDAAPHPVVIEANQVEELACALPPPAEDAHLDEVISIEDVGYF
jgi:hypothetical protein